MSLNPQNAPTRIVRLRCEGFDNPLGIDAARPLLSWQMETPRPGARQIAYRIAAASSPALLETPDHFDSGWVESAQSAHLEYAGAPLGSRARVFWRVEVEDETGARVQSAPAWWEMGLLERGDWKAGLISAPIAGGPLTLAPVPRFTREFTLDKPVAAARFYGTALGLYRCHLNGARVGDHELAPGWTDYRQSLRYQTFDVTSQLQEGQNSWTAFLGDGWASGHIGWKARQNYADRPHFAAQLEITYQDGTREVIATDDKWTCALGPMLGADLLQGESYDGRLPWREIGRVDVAPLPDVVLRAPLSPPVRATQELKAVSVHLGGNSHDAGRAWVFDLGQNMVGRVRLNLDALDTPLPQGTTLRLRFAETLAGGPAASEGPIYTTNLRSARQTDVFTVGDELETWEPLFTFHGFRYVEVTGLPQLEALADGPVKPPVDLVTGVVLHSDFARSGDFSCSDELINQLQRNIDWGWRGNSVDVPTDCPQRDERLGWTGDAQVFCATSLFNRDAAGFWSEWARQVREAQWPDGGIPCTIPNPESSAAPPLTSPFHDGGPAWSDAALICPWTTYRVTGNRRILDENYDVFQRYFEFLEATSQGNLRCFRGYEGFSGFGDWLALDGSGNIEGGTPKELIGTAFFAHAAALMSQIAQVLGKTEDAARYQARFEAIKAAFVTRFVTPEGRLSPPYQTPYLLALHFDLLPAELRSHAAAELVAEIAHRGGKLSTGFVGSPYLNAVLTRFGHLDTAYALLHQTGWPGWLYAVTQGATTIWERWDGWTQENGFQDVGMNSFNHYAYGAVGDWLYQTVAGIAPDPAFPGYQKFVLAPRPGGKLTSVRAHLDTPHGRIESEWKSENGEFSFRFVVPPNTRAQVVLPDGSSMEATAGTHVRRCTL
ncbi:MAG: glycoside hydrolase family 78 protein [Armatimonadetes bacterium]|nr:glycoside hydrolase family 78 protein [Armatimonadota bacterium]